MILKLRILIKPTSLYFLELTMLNLSFKISSFSDYKNPLNTHNLLASDMITLLFVIALDIQGLQMC